MKFFNKEMALVGSFSRHCKTSRRFVDSSSDYTGPIVCHSILDYWLLHYYIIKAQCCPDMYAMFDGVLKQLLRLPSDKLICGFGFYHWCCKVLSLCQMYLLKLSYRIGFWLNVVKHLLYVCLTLLPNARAGRVLSGRCGVCLHAAQNKWDKGMASWVITKDINPK